jgi:hypothetical protein
LSDPFFRDAPFRDLKQDDTCHQGNHQADFQEFEVLAVPAPDESKIFFLQTTMESPVYQLNHAFVGIFFILDHRDDLFSSSNGL